MLGICLILGSEVGAGGTRGDGRRERTRGNGPGREVVYGVFLDFAWCAVTRFVLDFNLLDICMFASLYACTLVCLYACTLDWSCALGYADGTEVTIRLYRW